MTRGSIGAFLDGEARSRALGYVATLEPSLSRERRFRSCVVCGSA
jgi:hypothetical protein